VEVKRPGQKKAAPTNSGNKKKAVGKFNRNAQGNDEDEDIEEEIATDREKDNHNDNIVSSLGHQAGITVSQSLGIDPSVDSLALDEYDHIEVVEV